MVLLQILLGSPLSLNLRNLAWHGFPLPGEMPPVLASTLLLLLPSIGHLLQHRGVRVKRHRPGVSIARVQLMADRLNQPPLRCGGARITSAKQFEIGSFDQLQPDSGGAGIAAIKHVIDDGVSQLSLHCGGADITAKRQVIDAACSFSQSPLLNSGAGIALSKQLFTEVATSRLLHERHVPVLVRIAERIAVGQFYAALLLSLPLLEAVLRGIFVELNGCPSRLLTGIGPPCCV